MKRAQLLALTFSLIAFMAFPVRADKRQRSPKARELTEALAALHSKPNDPAVQERYLKSFPHDYTSFLDLFGLNHELYDGYDYIQALSPLGTTHPMELGKLLVGLSKDAHHQADAPAYLQHVTAAYAAQHTKMFAQLLKELTLQEQTQLITFLADVENFHAYPDYEYTIKNLKSLGETDLASKFADAEKEREMQPSQCKLRSGLYRERKRLESEYASQVQNNYARRPQVADGLTAKVNGIDAEYYRFVYALADFGAKNDTGSLVACRSAAEQDPVTRQLAALVLYLQGSRKDPASFITSLPRTKAQLVDFWNLDTVFVHGESQEPKSLPAIPLPDGLVNKYISELFVLVQRGDPAAIQEYSYLYSKADGDHAEFIQDQVTTLFKENPELILRKWRFFRPIAEKLGATEDVSREEFARISAGFGALCRKRQDRSCREVLTIFH